MISPRSLARVDLPDAPRPRITTRFIFCSVRYRWLNCLQSRLCGNLRPKWAAANEVAQNAGPFSGKYANVHMANGRDRYRLDAVFEGEKEIPVNYL